MDKELKYSEDLAPFMEVIEKVYSPKEQVLWHWTHNPIIEDDFSVQAEKPMNVKNISLDNATQEEIINYIERYAISAYTTEDNAIAAYLEVREKRTIRQGESAGLKFDNQKGANVRKIHVTPEHGICDTPKGDNEHVNILTYKGVDPMTMDTGESVPVFKHQDNNDNEKSL